MKARRTHLIIHRPLMSENENRESYLVGYWEYPPPTERRNPVFRSFGAVSDEAKARELAARVVKERPQYQWRGSTAL